MKKTLIVTGAGGGLGRSVVKRLLQDDFIVQAVLGKHDDPEFMSAPNLYKEEVDLFNEKAAHDYVEKIVSKPGNLFGLIHLAGGFAMGDLLSTDGQDLGKMMQLNFETAYYMVRPFVKFLTDQKKEGQIVLIGSRPALRPKDGKNLMAYALSKGLIFHLSDLINAGYQKKDIHCSVIAPSVLDTPGNRKSMPDADPSTWVPTENVADLIAFILSDTGRMLREPIYKIYHKS